MLCRIGAMKIQLSVKFLHNSQFKAYTSPLVNQSIK